MIFNKGIYPREKNASEMMVGVEDVVTVEAVPAVLHVCQSQRGAMLHAALQVIPHGMTKVIAKEEKRKKREKRKREEKVDKAEREEENGITMECKISHCY